MKRILSLVLLFFLIGLFGFVSGNTFILTLEPTAVVYTKGNFSGWIGKGSPLNREDFILSDLRDSKRSLSNIKVPIIIPSYALVTQENDLIFKARLEEFVKRGGNIIVFDQQYGRHVEKIVPIPKGQRLKVYGWRESDSGYMGVYIDKKSINHPVFSFSERIILNIPHDGYFEKYPGGTKVLLRRKFTISLKVSRKILIFVRLLLLWDDGCPLPFR